MIKTLFVLISLSVAVLALPQDEKILDSYQKDHPDSDRRELRLVHPKHFPQVVPLGILVMDRGFELQTVYVDGKFLEPDQACDQLLKEWGNLSESKRQELAGQLVAEIQLAFEKAEQMEVSTGGDLVEIRSQYSWSGKRGTNRVRQRWVVSADGHLRLEQTDTLEGSD